jgi:hypothetical protein
LIKPVSAIRESAIWGTSQMEYSATYVREYLPREDPPFEQVPGEVHDEIARWQEVVRDDDGLTARATRWTYAVFSELGLGRFALDRPFFQHWPDEYPPLGALVGRDLENISFGLFDQKAEADGLGIIIDVPQRPGPSFQVVDYTTFPRLNNRRFPVAIRQSEIDLHASHLSNATSACWAQCQLNPAVWGVLTAGHAISGNHPGRSVPMASGSSWTLERSYYQPVDAAFVKGTPPASRSPLGVLAFPALSMAATVHCQSGAKAKTIVEVTNNCGVLHTVSVGILVYLDTPETAGDSGALVTVGNGDAVGIYKGGMQVPGPPPGVRGLAQNFEQAIYALDVDPYL